MIETQASLNAWADETFGPTVNIPHLLTRANLELAELLHEITMPVPDFEKIREECADVAGVLCRIAGIVGSNLDEVFALAPVIIDANLYPPASRAFQVISFLFERLSVRNVIRQTDIGRDIGIITIKLAEICVAAGGNLPDEIDRKAAILRQREWVKDGVGCGSHVRDALLNAAHAWRENIWNNERQKRKITDAELALIDAIAEEANAGE